MEKIKQLREKTGAGMVDCKKALLEANNDIEKAVEILRKKGIAKAAKREDKETSEGVIKIAVNNENNQGYIFELSAETDFVARNEKFIKLSDDLMEIIKKEKPNSIDELLNLSMEKNTIKETVQNFSGTIGEKIEIKKFETLKSNGTVGNYSHLGGKIGVLVSLNVADKKDLAYDIAMQVAASNPKYITSEDVPIEEIEKEKEIYKEQLIKQGKPENIIENILKGKINKYFKEVCLVDQEFIKEEKKQVKDILGDIKVEKIIRYSL